jgi:hypothetical protein
MVVGCGPYLLLVEPLLLLVELLLLPIELLLLPIELLLLPVGLLLRVLRTDERPVFFLVPYLVTVEPVLLYISIIFLKLAIDIDETSDPMCSVKILHAPLVICFRKVLSAIL